LLLCSNVSCSSMVRSGSDGKGNKSKFGRQWSYNEVLVRQRLVLKRPQEQPENWPADWHPDPDRWPSWLPRGWWQVRRRGYFRSMVGGTPAVGRSAWISPDGVVFKRKEHIRKHLDLPLRDGRTCEGMVKAHFPFEKEPETDTCPCYWPFRLPQDWRIGLKFEDRKKVSMCYYPPGDDTNYMSTLHEVEKAIMNRPIDLAFPAAPPMTSLLQALSDADEYKNVRLWTYKEVVAFRERRRTFLPNNRPEGWQLDQGWQLDPGRWGVWLPEGWVQVRKVGKDGISRVAWVSPEGSLFVRRELVQTHLNGGADATGMPEAMIPNTFPDEWPALLPQNWRMAVILGKDWGHPTMRFYPPGDDKHFVVHVNDVHRVIASNGGNPAPDAILAPQCHPSTLSARAALKAEPKAEPKARAKRRPRNEENNEERPAQRPRSRPSRGNRENNAEEIERSRKDLEAQLSHYMQLCRRQEQESTGMQRRKASKRAASGAAAASAASSYDDHLERANGALSTCIHDTERDLW